MENNEVNQIKLRKYEHTLVISGAGIILFGAWDIIKVAVFIVITPMDRLDDMITNEMRAGLEGADISNAALTYLVIAFVLMLSLVSLALRLFIGRAAIQDGRHIRRRRPVYIILAVLIGMGLLATIIGRAVALFSGTYQMGTSDPLDVTSVSIFVEATALLCVIELIVSAIMVRRLRTEAGRREAA